MTSDIHKERRLAIPFAPSIMYRGFTGKQFTPFFVEVIGSVYSTLQPDCCTTVTYLGSQPPSISSRTR